MRHTTGQLRQCFHLPTLLYRYFQALAFSHLFTQIGGSLFDEQCKLVIGVQQVLLEVDEAKVSFYLFLEILQQSACTTRMFAGLAIKNAQGAERRAIRPNQRQA